MEPPSALSGRQCQPGRRGAEHGGDRDDRHAHRAVGGRGAPGHLGLFLSAAAPGYGLALAVSVLCLSVCAMEGTGSVAACPAGVQSGAGRYVLRGALCGGLVTVAFVRCILPAGPFCRFCCIDASQTSWQCPALGSCDGGFAGRLGAGAVSTLAGYGGHVRGIAGAGLDGRPSRPAAMALGAVAGTGAGAAAGWGASCQLVAGYQ